MLILSRKIGEKIIINDEIEIVVVDSNSTGVKLGINAPKTVSIYREELYREIQATNKNSNTATFDALAELQNLITPKTAKQQDNALEKLTTKIDNE